MNEPEDILRKIKIEEYIWVVYLVIIGLSFYSNYIEKIYYTTNNICTKEKYRKLTILIFSIALLVYIYFFVDGYQDFKKLNNCDSPRKIFFNKASLTASTLILISGIIFLIIAIYDTELDVELAFS